MEVRSRPRAGGYSLVELLIAATLMIFIALGILPLFTRSVVSVRRGANATEVGNINRTAVEEYFQLAFNSPELTIDAGTEKITEQKFLAHSRQWVPQSNPELPADPAIWYRTTTVRQYGWNAVSELPTDDTVLTVDPSLALPAGSSGADIILKEIIVDIDQSADPGIFGDAQLTVRIFKTH